MKKYSLNIVVVLLHGFSLYGSLAEKPLKKKEFFIGRNNLSLGAPVDEVQGFLSIIAVETPVTKSSGSTPNSAKQRRSGVSSLSLNSVGSCFSKEMSIDAQVLERKICDFDMTPASAHYLGTKLLAFKEKNSEEAIHLIELLHNKAAAPLKGYFKDENGEFNKAAYNDFLEKSLPRICDAIQETPLIKVGNKSAGSSLTGSAFEVGRTRKRSVFEDSEDEAENN